MQGIAFPGFYRIEPDVEDRKFVSALVTQRIEWLASNQLVGSSNLSEGASHFGATHAALTQLVEYLHGKEEVIGSSPIGGSQGNKRL